MLHSGGAGTFQWEPPCIVGSKGMCTGEGVLDSVGVGRGPGRAVPCTVLGRASALYSREGPVQGICPRNTPLHPH